MNIFLNHLLLHVYFTMNIVLWNIYESKKKHF